MRIVWFTALLLAAAGCSKENPRVATAPNQQAALGMLPMDPLQGKVITSWIDRRNSTMSTLFGNDLAVQYARSGARNDYPAGSVLSLVTWQQQEDARWFGGTIPAAPKSVEFVTVQSGPSYAYQRYEGSPLKRVELEVVTNQDSRVFQFLSQRAAVLP